MIAETPTPHYFAVIFTSVRTEGDHGYAEMADRMLDWPGNRMDFWV